jgi:multidrug efflux system outer membrane protein
MTSHSRAAGNPFLAAFTAFLLSSCTVGPSYTRPEVEVPKDLGVAQAAADVQSCPRGDCPRWWTLFNDPALDQLVDEALAANHDLKAAAERIEQARAQVTIARAAEWPDAGVQATRSRQRASERAGGFELPPGQVVTTTNRLELVASWEIDFWGKFRRASEAARAELVAAEAGRDAVRASLVGDLVRGYFALRALDRRLEALDRTLAGRVKALELQKLRLDNGVVSELEFRQVESYLRDSEAQLPLARQDRLRQENALAVLLGRTPRALFEKPVERTNASLPAAVEVPAGLPSEVLLRRPDLRQAEAQLHAATARIGVARAAYFPSIKLTADKGGESQSLGDLFSAPARTWSIAGGLLQPLFAGGQLRGGLALADARSREALELYQKAAANAFREVRDALGAQTNARDALIALRAREEALARTLELAKLRYDNGAVSLFEVLETERQLLLARLQAIDAVRARAAAIVDLYLAMGL